MKTIDAKQCTAIALGRLGENDYTVVRFDVSAWITEIPGAVIGLYNQRPGDADAYPIAAIAVEDGVATWTVTSAELTQTGEGRCELVAIAGEVVAKSAIFRTMVFDALDGSGEVPEPWEEWQQQLIILKNEAEQAADRAEEAVEHYPRINNGVWEVWDGTTVQWVSTGVQAQGPQGVPGEQGETGEPGPQGETGPQGEPGADGVTFTPAVSAEGVISWTNDGGKTNPHPVNIKGPQGDKGDTGATGATGPTGQTGPAGTPGISPSITVTDITGGHRVTITDATGQHSFDVMNGEDGQGAVQDVQVNGVSVVTGGVANVPIAGASAGTVKVPTNDSYGLHIYSDGSIAIAMGSVNDIKNGSGYYKPIVPNSQHQATFYGLAKAAGADMASSSNPVGTYTDDAKVAIQKMLGVYQPPWELLNDITLTEESGFDLTADDNGTPYDLLGVYVRVYYAANLTEASTGYARYVFDDMDGHYVNAETGKYLTATSATCKFIHIIREGTLAIASYSTRSSVGGNQQWANKDLSSNGYNFNFGNIIRIRMNAADVEPAGTRIKIYGQRAY